LVKMQQHYIFAVAYKLRLQQVAYDYIDMCTGRAKVAQKEIW